MDPLLAALQSGKSKPAPRTCLPGLAAREGLNTAALQAIVAVETGGRTSFDAKGRPKFLFEPHHFFQLIPASKRATAVAMNVARPSFEKAYYNRFEKTLDQRWALLVQAADLDNAESAVGACSWGPAQIVAHLWAKKCGYPSASAFVLASLDEEQMLHAFIRVLLSMGLREAINQKPHPDFDIVARVYNGSANANDYSAKMRSKYRDLIG